VLPDLPPWEAYSRLARRSSMEGEYSRGVVCGVDRGDDRGVDRGVVRGVEAGLVPPPRPETPQPLLPPPPIYRRLLPGRLSFPPPAIFLFGGERGRSLGDRGIGSRLPPPPDKSRFFPGVDDPSRPPCCTAVASLVSPGPRGGLPSPRAAARSGHAAFPSALRLGEPESRRDGSLWIDCWKGTAVKNAFSVTVRADPVEDRDNLSALAACLARSLAISADFTVCDDILNPHHKYNTLIEFPESRLQARLLCKLVASLEPGASGRWHATLRQLCGGGCRWGCDRGRTPGVGGRRVRNTRE